MIACFRLLSFVFVAALAGIALPAHAEEITIAQSAGGRGIPATLARPKGPGPFPAVIVLHGCAGKGRLETTIVEALAREGYVGLAIDTLAPQGVENACEGAVKGASRRSAGYAAQSLAWLAAQPYVRADRLAAIGFSMGAIAVLDLVDPFVPHAPPPGLRAAVAYYPACRSRDGLVTAPLLILDGSDDDWTPAPPCAAMAQSGVAAGKPIEITTYPGATHSFNTPRNAATTYLGHTLRYDAAASDDAWSKTKKFLARYLAP